MLNKENMVHQVNGAWTLDADYISIKEEPQAATAAAPVKPEGPVKPDAPVKREKVKVEMRDRTTIKKEHATARPPDGSLQDVWLSEDRGDIAAPGNTGGHVDFDDIEQFKAYDASERCPPHNVRAIELMVAELPKVLTHRRFVLGVCHMIDVLKAMNPRPFDHVEWKKFKASRAAKAKPIEVCIRVNVKKPDETIVEYIGVYCFMFLDKRQKYPINYEQMKVGLINFADHRPQHPRLSGASVGLLARAYLDFTAAKVATATPQPPLEAKPSLKRRRSRSRSRSYDRNRKRESSSRRSSSPERPSDRRARRHAEDERSPRDAARSRGRPIDLAPQPAAPSVDNGRQPEEEVSQNAPEPEAPRPPLEAEALAQTSSNNVAAPPADVVQSDTAQHGSVHSPPGVAMDRRPSDPRQTTANASSTTIVDGVGTLWRWLQQWEESKRANGDMDGLEEVLARVEDGATAIRRHLRTKLDDDDDVVDGSMQVGWAKLERAFWPVLLLAARPNGHRWVLSFGTHTATWVEELDRVAPWNRTHHARLAQGPPPGHAMRELFDAAMEEAMEMLAKVARLD
ncbi:Aste57867_14595 [Aphanomyces stellatus]|uniref:Aste57867_14595 protein n=1 Tax=Aphanomyces stellatus TaxID=120398 RepID=A0A485L234_9STRA|nr:hypothetical protein As57867_014541 [Aphanomyces stellatus]VFT91414.1 Aste57867_14595 [Aphanomyces stellatus]